MQGLAVLQFFAKLTGALESARIPAQMFAHVENGFPVAEYFLMILQVQ